VDLCWISNGETVIENRLNKYKAKQRKIMGKKLREELDGRGM
jgi:hypothetical protein